MGGGVFYSNLFIIFSCIYLTLNSHFYCANTVLCYVLNLKQSTINKMCQNLHLNETENANLVVRLIYVIQTAVSQPQTCTQTILKISALSRFLFALAGVRKHKSRE